MKTARRVLIVDDNLGVLRILRSRFESRNGANECPYEFAVETVDTADKCLQIVRNSPRFDVIIFDKVLDGSNLDDDTGVRLALSFFIPPGDGVSVLPVRILFTAYETYPECVQTIRGGVWDYIPKKEANYDLVVDSAIDRLRQLDLHMEREEAVSIWLAIHLKRLEEKYPDRLVALWHRPQVEVVATGFDSFDLVEKIRAWKKSTGKKAWEEPTVLAIGKGDAPSGASE